MSGVYYVYALWSSVVKKTYVGFSKNPDKRLKAHNSGKSNWTRGKGPWVRFYLKSFPSLEEALSHEKYLKSGWGRKIVIEELDKWKKANSAESE